MALRIERPHALQRLPQHRSRAAHAASPLTRSAATATGQLRIRCRTMASEGSSGAETTTMTRSSSAASTSSSSNGNGNGSSASSPSASTELLVPDWPCGVHSVHLEVRDTELDQFSVVNNNRYGEYMQHGRHKALKSMGAGVGDYQQKGVLMALSELNIKYKTPLRSGDRFRVDTSVDQVTAARLVMKQVVVREEDNGKTLAVCAEGLATVVFLDEAYRPVRLPAGDRQVFEALRQAAARGKP